MLRYRANFKLTAIVYLGFLSYHLKNLEHFFVFPVVYREKQWLPIDVYYPLTCRMDKALETDLESNLVPFDHDEVMEFELFDEHKNTSVINTIILNLW